LKEQAEFFSECGAATDNAPARGNECDDKFAYAINEFGAPGMEFKDWVASQSVDPQVIKNHSEFVKDRLTRDNTQNVTGRTFSPDFHDSYNPANPWTGLRRPEGVNICNPDQVPDMDYSLFAKTPSISWATS
jgi:hypothetical protein